MSNSRSCSVSGYSGISSALCWFLLLCFVHWPSFDVFGLCAYNLIMGDSFLTMWWLGIHVLLLCLCLFMCCDLYGLIRLLLMCSLCMFHALLVVNLYCQLCSIVESIWICLCGIIPTVHSMFCISDAVVLFRFELHCCCYVILLSYSGFCFMICSVASCWLRTNKVWGGHCCTCDRL